MAPTPQEILKRITELEAAGLIDEPEWFNIWADYWRYVIGVNVIPAEGRLKGTPQQHLMMAGIGGWDRWQHEPISDEVHEQWKADNLFYKKRGMAIITGKVWHNPNALSDTVGAVDKDNALAQREFCSVEGRIKPLSELAQETIIEQHLNDPTKSHFIAYFDRPLTNKASDNKGPLANKLKTNEVPAFEVMGSEKLIFVTPSIHKSGIPYQIIGTKIPNKVFKADLLEQHIDNICRKYGAKYLEYSDGQGNSRVPKEEYLKEDYKTYEGNNRHEQVMRVMEHYLFEGILSHNQIRKTTWEYNQMQCVPPLPDSDMESQWKCALNFVENVKKRQKKKEEYYKETEDGNNDNTTDLEGIDKKEQKKREESLKEKLNKIIITPRFGNKIVKSFKYGSNENGDGDGGSGGGPPPPGEGRGGVGGGYEPSDDRRKEIDKELNKLYKEFKGFNIEVIFDPSYIIEKYDVKTTIPDIEKYCFDKEHGVFNLNGEFVIKHDLETAGRATQDKFDQILKLLNEKYTWKNKSGNNITDVNAIDKELLRNDINFTGLPEWTKKMLDEYIGHVERQTYFDRNHFNPNIEWLACEDCMINLLTGDTAPFDPKYLNTTYIPVKYHVYEPNPIGVKKYSSCPKIMKFLHEVMEPSDVEIVLDFTAYCLWREYKFHNWILFNGAGQNGKSTWLRVIARFLGSHNVSSESLQRILEREFSSAQLYGKLANIDADLSTEALKNTGLLKKLTGGDTLTGERKHKPLFEFTNYAKLLFSANTIPASTDLTNAFFRRLIIINFTRQFFGDADNPNLYNELTTEEELSGLLRVCIQRLPRVLKNGIRPTTNENLGETEKQYLRSTDPIGYFIDNALNSDPQLNTPKDVVYESYARFCKHFKLAIESEYSFSKRLSACGYKYKKYRYKGDLVVCWTSLKVSNWLKVEDDSQKSFEELYDTPPSTTTE